MTNLILVTGATGFVGRQVLRVLREKGVRIRLVMREGKQNELADRKGIESVITTPDLFDESSEWWKNACAGVDTVIHVAWYTEPGHYLQSLRNFDCLAGTLQLVKGAVGARVRRFIGIGTCFEYAFTGGMLSIDTPLCPSTPYAAAKAAVFMALSQWLPPKGVEFAWCRLFYLFGAGEDSRRLVPYVRSKLAAGEAVELTTGTQIRDFIDVAQAGRRIAEAALGKMQGPLNICSGKPVSVRQLAEQLADEYGRRDLLKFGARPDNIVDPSFVVGIATDVTQI